MTKIFTFLAGRSCRSALNSDDGARQGGSRYIGTRRGAPGGRAQPPHNEAVSTEALRRVLHGKIRRAKNGCIRRAFKG